MKEGHKIIHIASARIGKVKKIVHGRQRAYVEFSDGTTKLIGASQLTGTELINILTLALTLVKLIDEIIPYLNRIFKQIGDWFRGNKKEKDD